MVSLTRLPPKESLSKACHAIERKVLIEILRTVIMQKINTSMFNGHHFKDEPFYAISNSHVERLTFVFFFYLISDHSYAAPGIHTLHPVNMGY